MGTDDRQLLGSLPYRCYLVDLGLLGDREASASMAFKRGSRDFVVSTSAQLQAHPVGYRGWPSCRQTYTKRGAYVPLPQILASPPQFSRTSRGKACSGVVGSGSLWIEYIEGFTDPKHWYISEVLGAAYENQNELVTL